VQNPRWPFRDKGRVDTPVNTEPPTPPRPYTPPLDPLLSMPDRQPAPPPTPFVGPRVCFWPESEEK
jgi:hypothetical protein